MGETPERIQVGARLPADLVQWYRDEAERREVSVNYLVTVACQRWRRENEGQT